jgi:hypothetical protein
VQDGIQLEFDKIEGDVRVHCDNRNRFIVSTDEKLTAFLELERVTCEASPRRSANKVDLPAPVGANQSDPIAAIDLERDIVEQGPAGERF